jgi:penicillin amidase
VRSDTDRVARARRLLCAWDGVMRADSAATTLYVLLSNAMLDAALADELRGGSQSATWKYTQSLLQFEADVQWLWSRPESAPVWDDVTTPVVETKRDILEQALVRAVAVGSERYGENPETWLWGRVRPFVLRHPFAPRHGFLAAVLNSEPIAVGGDTETVFKQQFVRADREHMHPAVGPVVRFTVDMADPWRATYGLAGGESGWPKSPYYGNLLDDWRTGRGRPLTPPASSADTHVRFVPAA